MDNGIRKLPPDKLRPFADTFEQVESQMGFVPNSLYMMAHKPFLLGSFSMLYGAVMGLEGPAAPSPWRALKMGLRNLLLAARARRQGSKTPRELKVLVALATSNAAGCRYCQAHAGTTAGRMGIAPEKIDAIWEVDSSPRLSEAERAAIRFALAAGTVPNGVTQQHFDELHRHFDDEQIVELLGVIALFGFLNRWNDSAGTPLEDEPAAFAQQYLAPRGWAAGKHRPKETQP